MKPLPIDCAQAGDSSFERDALDIEDELVADLRFKIARDFLVERDRNDVARFIIDVPNPFACGDFFRLGKLRAIG